MADPKVTIYWKQPAHLELRDSYSRAHTMRFAGGIRVAATDNFVDEPPLVDRYVTAAGAFAAALASSYAMTFLYVAMEQGVDVAECEIDALVEHGEWFWRGGGDPEIRHVTLCPTVVFRGPRPTNRAELALHRETQRRCPLAKAVKCEIRVSLLCEALVGDGHD